MSFIHQITFVTYSTGRKIIKYENYCNVCLEKSIDRYIYMDLNNFQEIVTVSYTRWFTSNSTVTSIRCNAKKSWRNANYCQNFELKIAVRLTVCITFTSLSKHIVLYDERKIKIHWNETDIYVNQIVDLFSLAMKWTWRTKKSKLIEIKSTPINHCVWSLYFFLIICFFALILAFHLQFILLTLFFLCCDCRSAGVSWNCASWRAACGTMDTGTLWNNHCIRMWTSVPCMGREKKKREMQINPSFLILSFFLFVRHSFISSDQIYTVFCVNPKLLLKFKFNVYYVVCFFVSLVYLFSVCSQCLKAKQPVQAQTFFCAQTWKSGTIF